MRITEQMVNGKLVLSLEGRMVFGTRKEFQKAIKQAQEKSPRDIVVDLERVTYIDSAGLGLIGLAFESSKLHHIVFSLANPTGKVKDILEMVNFFKIMGISTMEQSASYSGAETAASANS